MILCIFLVLKLVATCSTRLESGSVPLELYEDRLASIVIDNLGRSYKGIKMYPYKFHVLEKESLPIIHEVMVFLKHLRTQLE